MLTTSAHPVAASNNGMETMTTRQGLYQPGQHEALPWGWTVKHHHRHRSWRGSGDVRDMKYPPMQAPAAAGVACGCGAVWDRSIPPTGGYPLFVIRRVLVSPLLALTNPNIAAGKAPESECRW